MRGAWAIVVLIAVASGGAAGCATSKELAREAAMERASREYRCPKEQVQTRFLGKYGSHRIIQVNACGHVSNYACYGNSATGKGGCLKESRER